MGDAELQKTFCTGFLTKKMKKNEGELLQYRVRNSHPAIVSAEVLELVSRAAGSLEAGTVAGAYSPAKSCVRIAEASSGAKSGTQTIHIGQSFGGATESMKKGVGAVLRRMSEMMPSKRALCR